jgi:hypothetical protein
MGFSIGNRTGTGTGMEQRKKIFFDAGSGTGWRGERLQNIGSNVR